MKSIYLFIFLYSTSSFAFTCPKINGSFSCPSDIFGEGYTFSIETNHNEYIITQSGEVSIESANGKRVDGGAGFFETEYCENDAWVLKTESPDGIKTRVDRFIRNGNFVLRITGSIVKEANLSNTNDPDAQEYICDRVY